MTMKQVDIADEKCTAAVEELTGKEVFEVAAGLLGTGAARLFMAGGRDAEVEALEGFYAFVGTALATGRKR